MTKQRLGILGGMGPLATADRLAPCGDPDDLICSGQMNCPGIKVLAVGQNACDAALAASGPMPLHDRRDGYV